MKRIFTIALLAATLAVSVLGDEDLYLVTFRSEAAIDRLATIAEQFAATYGGSVVELDVIGSTMLMRLPGSRVTTAGRDPRVQSIRPAGRARIATDAVEVVPWGTGVTYAYDGAGNVTDIGSDEFVYDVASRLVQSKINDQTRNYEYDAFGNRTGCMQGSTDCQGHTIDAATNRISGANNHDAAGNVTSLDGHQYSYDALNMQIRDVDTTSGVTREYVYTADDERIAVYTVNQWWRWTIRDTSGKVLREYMSQGTQGTSNWQWVKDYIWRDGILLVTRHVPPGGSTAVTYHYHVDHLGTPRRITDDSDRIVGFHDYLAFGPETSTGKSEPSLSVFKYTGHERDIADSSTSPPLDYMLARYYSSRAGRFLSVDKIKGQPSRPQSWNGYAYVTNNPIRAVDPKGLYEVNCGMANGTECAQLTALLERRLNTLRNSHNAVLRRIAANYGARGQANGVIVTFGNTGAATTPASTGTTSQLGYRPSLSILSSGNQLGFYSGPYVMSSITVTFQANANAITAHNVLHEGVHVGRAQSVFGSTTDGTPNFEQQLKKYFVESEAYRMNAAAVGELGEISFGDRGQHAFMRGMNAEQIQAVIDGLLRDPAMNYMLTRENPGGLWPALPDLP